MSLDAAASDTGKDPSEPPLDDTGAGLTDDERVSREEDAETEGGLVEPGPADLERLPKADQ